MLKLQSNQDTNCLQTSHYLPTHNGTDTSIQPANNVLHTPLVCASAFSGIGAFEQAIKNLHINHTNAFMIDIDTYARKTYLANHAVNNVYTDITTIEVETLPNMDLFVFGSPCQSFSTQGKQRGLEDTRGTLIYNGLSIIKTKQPKYFIFENVKGLINHDSGKTFEIIQAAFKELNYSIQHTVLNSKHFGLPQNRERLFVVGIRNDISQTFEFPKPCIAIPCVNDFIEEGEIDPALLFSGERSTPKKPNSKTDIKIIAEFEHIKFNTDKRICSTAGIAPCLRVGGKTHFYDTKNNCFRFLSVKESAKIQGFGESFIFPVSTAQARKQIGNSISVPVLQAVLKNLLLAQELSPSVEIQAA